MVMALLLLTIEIAGWGRHLHSLQHHIEALDRRYLNVFEECREIVHSLVHTYDTLAWSAP
jgi:hypothetical protein